MRIGSLFSGAGGLDLAVEAVFGGRTVWQCERDEAASAVLAYRWPGVPNLGDITAVDWSAVEPVDVLCGGFPCQDVSSAGRRAGLAAGTRSGLWSHYAAAIDALRPRFVVIENVRGLLSAKAHRAVESDASTVGDGQSDTVLRAAGAVLGDLADIGYDAQWTTVSAASVGAPHKRERVLILAVDTEGTRRGVWDTTHVRTPDREVDASGHDSHTSSDAACDGWDERRPESTGFVGGSDAAVGSHGPVDLIPTPRASDAGPRGGTTGFGLRNWTRDYIAGDHLLPTPTTQDGSNCAGPSQFDRNTLPLNAAVTLLPTPEAKNAHAGPDYARMQREGSGGHDLVTAIAYHDVAQSRWGKYAPAIERWQALTRPAPSPTEPNTKGNPRLAAAFAEWMQGWPDGWCTDPAIGISRNDQLRIVGNGVCPQQAVAAQRQLLSFVGYGQVAS